MKMTSEFSRRLQQSIAMTALLAAISGWSVSCQQSPPGPNDQAPVPVQQESHAVEMTNPDSVLLWLQQGNEMFVKGLFDAHGVDSSLRVSLSKGQHPRAVILTCADSRVSPELVFDKGLGDLFVIRVAGNIEDDAVLGSIEYAVEHLHTPLVIVMGHKNCGAIAAAVADWQDTSKVKIDNHIRALTDRIELAMASVDIKEGDLSQKALQSNVVFTVRSLRTSRPELKEAIDKGHLKIAGAIYDVSTGKVDWLND
jgi:carbonic anhydrase